MNSKLKTLQIIHLALSTGVFLFAAVTILISKDELIFDANFETTSPFNPIFPIIALAGVFASMVIFRKSLVKIDRTLSLDSKILQYQTAFIVSAALLEGGALLNIVGCMLTKNAFFLIFAGICLFFLIRSRPTKDKLIRELELQYPETEEL
ncbi:hypothetical protein EZJ43_04255 [Pedobacter changchengzhani]|uniref:DUF4293 family protein n=1 Tax=Pedobacter changchengzhani TaxID=2529274 RepID=A0A4R5MNS6_9SPHI|nr:hypothetical protein [Pedobacter changchengzhani]TDG37338.1 hypothetical protein EZJ43_04255 [Pedobacter changchengzhani]